MADNDKPSAEEQGTVSKFYHAVADPVSKYWQQVKGVAGILDDAKESSTYISEQKAPMVNAVAPEAKEAPPPAARKKSSPGLGS